MKISERESHDAQVVDQQDDHADALHVEQADHGEHDEHDDRSQRLVKQHQRGQSPPRSAALAPSSRAQPLRTRSTARPRR